MSDEIPMSAAEAVTFQQNIIAGTNIKWIMTAGCVVFFMQSGFALLESGAVRFKNYQNILLKNCMDACLGALVWWATGYALAYGDVDG